ncbi:MAG: NADPH-dependent F420 reductase [Woeseiaceae bacterium]|nr:NADPH-dependent F420 reductase [Woeseiaceae bacterium]
MKKIGVLGTGDVGRTLAAGLAGVGHSVMIGTRDPSRDSILAWQRDDDNAVQIGTFGEAAAFGDILILAVGWPNVDAVIELAGDDRFDGKVLLDATNPLRFEKEGEPPVLDIGHTDSAGEVIQRRLPGARVVKAFNIVGSVHMVQPDFPGGEPDMFICGDDGQSKQAASELIESLGWPSPIDLGGIENSRYLESMAMVWIVHFFNAGFQGTHAFKLLRKQ